jgi:transposase-like protein
MKKTNLERELIISEYLLGNTTYRQLGKKHGVDFRIIHSWVTKFKGKTLVKIKSSGLKKSKKEEELPAEIKKLQEELRKAKLHNELLNTMIDIAENQLNIKIRKKSGTKR